jgi:hypothetical protein
MVQNFCGFREGNANMIREKAITLSQKRKLSEKKEKRKEVQGAEIWNSLM